MTLNERWQIEMDIHKMLRFRAEITNDPIIEKARIDLETRDILDYFCGQVDNDKELGSWNRMNAICILRNAQRHILGVDTWEFTFNV